MSVLIPISIIQHKKEFAENTFSFLPFSLDLITIIIEYLFNERIHIINFRKTDRQICIRFGSCRINDSFAYGIFIYKRDKNTVIDCISTFKVTDEDIFRDEFNSICQLVKNRVQIFNENKDLCYLYSSKEKETFKICWYSSHQNLTRKHCFQINNLNERTVNTIVIKHCSHLAHQNFKEICRLIEKHGVHFKNYIPLWCEYCDSYIG